MVNSPSKAGADWLQTVWPWPMTFSFGVVKKRPLVVANKVEAQETMPLILDFDRRIMGGDQQEEFLLRLQKFLKPQTLNCLNYELMSKVWGTRVGCDSHFEAKKIKGVLIEKIK